MDLESLPQFCRGSYPPDPREKAVALRIVVFVLVSVALFFLCLLCLCFLAANAIAPGLAGPGG